MKATLSVTVDVDGEAGLPDGGRGYEHRLTSRSERAYGLRCGLPRVLAALEQHGCLGTFYIPGVTADRHPDEAIGIAAAGHEIGHHGHTHRRPDTLSKADQRAEITDGLAALSEVTGHAPQGYRAPGWELTTTTLEAVVAVGLHWDSSLMGDDAPYPLGKIIELPVHWSLDDAPYFAVTTDPRGLLAVWLCELDLAAAEDRPITMTLHPEILGRPHRIDVLGQLLERASALGMDIIPHGRLLERLAAR